MPQKTLKDFGIDIEPGSIRAYCPQCSPGRKKSYEKCLSVDQEKGLWFCHHCGFSGGVGGTSEEKKAARQFIAPHFVKSEITDEAVLGWFARRGIGRRTLADFHIKSGFAWMQGQGGGGNVSTVQFPYFLDGKVVNVKYRTDDKRFRQEKDAKKCFYNYDRAIKSASDKLVITEGEMDVLALYECGIQAAVSVPDGAPSPDAKTYVTKFDFLRGAESLFEKFERVVLAVDNDAPGLKLQEELCRRIGLGKCMQVKWPEGCKDANDVLMQHGVDALRRCIAGATLFPIYGAQTVADLWNLVFDLHANPEQPGASIGWENAAGVFNVETGQVSVITGVPSHGKSTFIDALRVILFRLHAWPSAVFSPENWPSEKHLALLVEMYTATPFRQMTTDSLFDAMSSIRNGFFFIQPEKDDDMMTVDAILSCAKELVYRHGIKILVIDPWNEVDHQFPPGQREDQYISVQLAKIRRFARVNAVHIFVIAHPRLLEKDKKTGTYAAPTAYDIAGGAMWRNKADNILCVYRPDITTGEVVVYVQKIRFRRNGTAGAAMKFTFHVGTSTYWPEKE